MGPSALKRFFYAPVEVAYDCGRALRGPLPPALKRAVAATQVRLLWRRAVTRASVPVDVRVGDHRLRASNLPQLRFLHREIFVNLEYYFRCERPDPFILDCGSNIGAAILFFKQLYPQSTIIGFEPAAAPFALLQHNLSANRLTRVETHQLALGARDGEVDFFLDNDPGSLQMSTLRERSAGERVKVRQARLSPFVEREVDFLKLDIEGAEDGVLDELVLAGALPRIAQMVIEYHHHVDPKRDELSAFLGKLEANGFGYQIAGECPIAARYAGGRTFQDVQIYAYRK